MKKTWTLFPTALLLLSLGFSMTACSKNADKLMDSYTVEKSLSLKKNALEGTAGTYEFLSHDGAGHIVVKVSAKQNYTTVDTYKILDLKTGSFINGVSDEKSINVLGEGFFYSVKTQSSAGVDLENPLYTLYGVNGTLVSGVTGTVEDGVFYEDNGTRWYVDHDGKIQRETNPFAHLFTEYDLILDDYYVSYEDDILYVYDEDGNLKKPLNISQELNLTENDELLNRWYVEDRLFVQVATALPEDAKKYDFTESSETEGELQKYNLSTYSYSLEKDKVKEIKNFDYIVEDICYFNQESTVLNVREIVDGNVSENEIIQSFNKNGKVEFDVQKLVPSACDVERVGNYVVFYDNSEFMHVYKGKECLLSLPDAEADFSFIENTSKVYYTFGDTLYVYDLESKTVVKSVANVVNYGKTQNGNLYYSVSKNSETEYTVYNVQNGSENKTTFNAYQSITGGGFSSSYYIMSSTNAANSSTTYSIAFPDSDISSLTGTESAGSNGSYYCYDLDGNDYTLTAYTILYTVNKSNLTNENVYSYHILTRTYERDLADD